jgi:hypothetical protein
MDLRARIPDAPAVHNPPILVSLTGTNLTGGQFQPGTTNTLAATGVTNWGETAPSNQQSITLTGSQNAIVAQVQMSGIQIQTINIYQAGQGTPLTSTADMWSFPAQQASGIGNYDVGVGTPLVHTALPTRSTAFLPDTDGNFIGAYTAFRLLNRALQEMVKIGGGIVDITGVQSQINQSMYRLASPFYQFTNAWYDGYPMDVVPRSFMYLRNSAAGFSGILSYEQDGPQSVIQVWPQSNRTGGSNQLAGNILADTNFFQMFNGAGFLSIGLAQIDSEIVAFSSVNHIIDNAQQPPFNNIWQFNGVTRGLGGTDAVVHSANAPVTELNIRLSGYRLAETYDVGDSNQTIMVPPAWETPVVLHMLSQVRSMEQDEAGAEKLLSDFQSQADKIAKQSRLGRLKPRQIPVWGQNTSDARNVNGIGFGWLIN